MKKKLLYTLFTILFLLICLSPFVLMQSFGMQESKENKTATAFPSVKVNDKWNIAYLSELGSWFEENFAFRNELVSANGKLYADAFGVSSQEKIIAGTDGWLYAKATLNDYQSMTSFTDRQLYNMAHSLALIQNRVESEGRAFLFTVPCNKNTLYDDNMPYYYKKGTQPRSLLQLQNELEQQGVSFVDLYSLFNKQEETLYLKRDSHWNNDGAKLAYNAVMSHLNIPHNTYQNSPKDTRCDYIGDLANMIYPEYAKAEENTYYPNIFDYEYLSDTDSVEENTITTTSPYGSGNLLMYRDSFGNTLLPFLAGEFASAHFSKYTPYFLEQDLALYNPDVVIIELVERQLNNLALQAPVMETQSLTIKDDEIVDMGDLKNTSDTTISNKTISDTTKNTKRNTNADTSANASNKTTLACSLVNDMYLLQGMIDERYVSTDTNIYIRITGAKETSSSVTAGSSAFGTNVSSTTNPSLCYETFGISIPQGDTLCDSGYQLYLRKETVPSGELTIEILTKQSEDNTYQRIATYSRVIHNEENVLSVFMTNDNDKATYDILKMNEILNGTDTNHSDSNSSDTVLKSNDTTATVLPSIPKLISYSDITALDGQSMTNTDNMQGLFLYNKTGHTIKQIAYRTSTVPQNSTLLPDTNMNSTKDITSAKASNWEGTLLADKDSIPSSKKVLLSIPWNRDELTSESKYIDFKITYEDGSEQVLYHTDITDYYSATLYQTQDFTYLHYFSLQHNLIMNTQSYQDAQWSNELERVQIAKEQKKAAEAKRKAEEQRRKEEARRKAEEQKRKEEQQKELERQQQIQQAGQQANENASNTNSSSSTNQQTEGCLDADAFAGFFQ